ncbi:MAG TPA: hypothetical protein VF549_08265 [Solirubrobacteraceae bacterium]
MTTADGDDKAVLHFNANHVRKVAVGRIRDSPGDVAALIEVLEGPAVHVELRDGFADVDTARAALARESKVNASRRLYLVHRPPCQDYVRPRPVSEPFDVEWY